MTSSVRSDCICCDTEGSRPAELPNPTSRRTQSSDEETCGSRLSSSARYQDRSPNAEYRGGVIEHSSTKCEGSRPKNHCILFCRTPTSEGPFQELGRQKEPTCLWQVDRGQVLAEHHRRTWSCFFPPNENSPSFTFVLVSMEISSVSGSSSDSRLAALTFSKIASVCSVFFSGLPF